MQMRVALIEQNNFHYEMILPVLQPLLNLNCIVNIFAQKTNLGLSNFMNDKLNIKIPFHEPKLIFAEYKKFDLLIFLTFPCYHHSDWKKCGCFEKILSLDKPKILFSHFPEVLVENNFSFREDLDFIFHVSPHGSKWFDTHFFKQIKSHLFIPLFRIPSFYTKQKRQICIVGQINYYRRDYTKVLKRMTLKENSDLQLIIAGRCHDNQIEKLKREIIKFNLEDRVKIETFISYEKFYQIIQTSQFLITALEKTKKRYFLNALTASIIAAISCNTSCVVEDELIKQYPKLQSNFISEETFWSNRNEKLLSSENDCKEQVLKDNLITLEKILLRII